MLRLLHTADWQMGMMATGLGPAAARVRAARLDSLRNLLALAADREAQAILVAGDLFEDNQVGSTVVEGVVGLLNDATRVPIHIIPGNHDPFTRDSVYRRPVWSQLRGHIKVHTTFEPVRLAADALLFPCPLDRKFGMDDPTTAIPVRNGGAELRVGLAHGTMRIRPGVGDDYFPIALDAADRRGLDYLALGHWHSTLAADGVGAGAASARACYSGTHETTRFGERDSGNAVLVTLNRPGEPPAIETLRTGVLRWTDLEIDLDRQPIADAARTLREWPEAERTLLRLTLRGALPPQASAELLALRDLARERFVHCAIDESQIRPADTGDEIFTTPHLRQTAEALRALASGAAPGIAPAPGQTAPAASPEVARRALQILHQAAWSARA
ncbi:MAG: metallophosphoesterase [Planctomycetota bacterium]|nr:metallophosphoesterase [Planctomycetota bacterium]